MIEFVQAVSQITWPGALVVCVALFSIVAIWRS